MAEQEQAAAAVSPERVGFGTRLGAALLDIFIVAVVGGVVGFVFGAALGGMLGAATTAKPEGAAAGGLVGAMLGFGAGMLLVGVLYGLWEGITGAAAGKRLLGIRIANADGTTAPVGTLMTRYAVKNSNMILNIVGGITGIAAFQSLGSLAGLAIFVGCFFVLGAARQAFHDMAAKTAVFRVGDIRQS